jgi:hypothetical protein
MCMLRILSSKLHHLRRDKKLHMGTAQTAVSDLQVCGGAAAGTGGVSLRCTSCLG